MSQLKKKGDPYRPSALPCLRIRDGEGKNRVLFNTFGRRNSYRFYEPFLFTMQLFKKLHDIRVVIGEKLS